MSEERRIRFVPWLARDDKSWNCTMKIEWLRDGKCYRDECHWMSAAQFDQMKKSMLEADNSDL